MNILVTSFVALILSIGSSHAQAACRVSGQVTPRQIHRGMYVSLYSGRILGNFTEENKLLSFINKHQFDSLSLYDMPTIMSNPTLMAQLSKFIQAARACGVSEINAIGARFSMFQTIKKYQDNLTYPGKFDGAVTEIEFWNQIPADNSFNNFIVTLQETQYIGFMSITPYIGWLNKNPDMTEAQEAKEIADNSSRVFVHAYVKNPSNAYGYVRTRLNALKYAKPSLPVWPIFSAEGVQYRAGSESFMGDWLAANSLQAAENAFMQSYVPQGFQYFEYSFLRMYLK